MKSHRTLLIILIVGLMLCISNPVSAWDGERKGFLIGLDAGFGFSSTFQTRPFVDNGLGQARPGTNPPPGS